jgi:hypothetical protein
MYWSERIMRGGNTHACAGTHARVRVAGLTAKHHAIDRHNDMFEIQKWRRIVVIMVAGRRQQIVERGTEACYRRALVLVALVGILVIESALHFLLTHTKPSP